MMMMMMTGGVIHLVLVLFLLISVLLGGCRGSTTTASSVSDDILGLIVFKSELHDPYSYLDSWNEDDNSPCSWKFVQCNPVSGRVSQVSLDGLGLSGKIGAGIIRGLQKLQSLKVLSLSYNNLTGDITSLNNIIPPSLERLNLSHNTLSGRISIPPSSSSCSIKFLDLSANWLTGPLPDNMFETLTFLRYLSLSDNSFEGPVPSTLFSRCTSLSNLNLSNNHFSGNLDQRIWSLTRLRTLDLSQNVLSGSLPQGISIIHNLKQLNLQGNDLSGLIPSDIGLCPHLIRLDLSHNIFTGVIPGSLQRLSSLTYLNLSSNMLTGDLPMFGNMGNSLQHLDLSNNKFTGTIPASLAFCTKLSVVRLRDNALSGSLPEGLFGDSTQLEEIDFSKNELVGSIPARTISKLQFESSLRILDLSRNKLTGDILAPDDQISLFSSSTSKLTYLNLSWNNLQSSIPPRLGLIFQNLAVLDLRYTALYGSIPADMCNSGSNLGILQLDGNSLTGPIPQDIGINCSSLYLLSLSHNNLSGSIPKSISMLSKLEILKLEFNQLSGEIPQELSRLENLLAVNISYNLLTGRLPGGSIFPNLDQSALQGNLGICSPLLKGPCKMNVPKPLVLDPYHAFGTAGHGHSYKQPSDTESPKNFPHRNKFLSVSAIVAISAAIAITLGVIVISLANVSARRRIAMAFSENSLIESMCSSSTSSSFSRSRNQIAAMQGKLILFDDSKAPLASADWNIMHVTGTNTTTTTTIPPESLINKSAEIGGGIFGTVYKASLGVGGGVVAIKKLITSNIIQHPEDFDREVRILGKARHPNLVALKGYYWTPQLQLLVSEYAPSGSLKSRLHDHHLYHQTPPLTWSTRFKIVLGTAKGLAHLHHSCRPPIIHYDIKPSNILLDDNFNPKISDFGLARLVKKLDKHVISSRFQSALGYVAPELACQSLRVNEKCDIYGFGVLILELVTGRRPVEYGEDNVVILTDHVRALLEQGNVLECVDPSMKGEYPEEEVLPVLKLALVCTSQIPSSRPSMVEVVQILQVIKTGPTTQRMEVF